MFRVTFSDLIVIFGVLAITSKTEVIASCGRERSSPKLNIYGEPVMPEVQIVYQRMKQQDRCFEPKDSGPCRSILTRWYYNSHKGKCEHFKYGGCLGNGNNFPSQVLCTLQCYEPLDSGMDKGMVTIHVPYLLGYNKPPSNLEIMRQAIFGSKDGVGKCIMPRDAGAGKLPNFFPEPPKDEFYIDAWGFYFKPDRGHIVNGAGGCLDTLGYYLGGPLGVKQCNSQMGWGNINQYQMFHRNSQGKVKTDYSQCAEASCDGTMSMENCTSSPLQVWQWGTHPGSKWIVAPSLNLCVSAAGGLGEYVKLAPCEHVPTQFWTFKVQQFDGYH